MLTLSGALRAAIIAHARADHPDEACGVIAGHAGSDHPERFIPMTNAERSPTFYRFDSMEQLRVWRGKGERGGGAGGVYHSPTPTPADPPPPPHPAAGGPWGHHVLVSTPHPHHGAFRSFRPLDRVV